MTFYTIGCYCIYFVLLLHLHSVFFFVLLSSEKGTPSPVSLSPPGQKTHLQPEPDIHCQTAPQGQ